MTFPARVSPELALRRPRKASSEAALRPTRAEVDRSALVHNYRALQRLVAPAHVLAVVKADGYGHGAIEVAQALQAAGAYGFGVALAEEGLELREAGVRGEIFVLNGVYGSAVREVLEARLTPIIYSLEHAKAFADAALHGAPGRHVDVHLKVDTGMSRLGVPYPGVEDFLLQLRAFRQLRITGVLTHFAASDSDPEFTGLQLDRLHEAVTLVRKAGHPVTCVHAANSGGCLRKDAHFDLVRPGLVVYGVEPSAHWEPSGGPGLRPALRIRSELITVRTLAAGDTVGYDRCFLAPRDGTRIAVAPVGYGDGMFWRNPEGPAARQVLVHGRRCPIAGRVSMDLTAIDITACPEAVVGDEVVLLGSQGAENLSVAEVAKAVGTIPYEILTNVSRRVPRSYRG